MRRAFRDLFEDGADGADGADGTPAVGPEVAIINLSVRGVPRRQAEVRR